MMMMMMIIIIIILISSGVTERVSLLSPGHV
jgi:hypothetical protein